MRAPLTANARYLRPRRVKTAPMSVSPSRSCSPCMAMMPHRGPSRMRMRPAPSHQNRMAPSEPADGDASPSQRDGAIATRARSRERPITPS
eukprot:scaffold123284_cov32-Tisochrysis_lutea.AAC.5